MSVESLSSRTTEDPFGKATERVESAVSEQVKGDMAVYWRLLGFESEAAYVRDLILKDLYGSYSRVQIMAQRAVRLNPGNTRGIPG